jgi:outer membrane protein assembly factor BamB
MEPLRHGDPARVRDYRLLARLGAGGMGVVYLGLSPAGRAVAVKVIRPRLAGDDAYRARFRREAAAASTVTGAFTAAVLDADPDATEPWLVTAYLPGVTLREAVATYGGLPPASVRTLAAGLAEALADIHRAGLVHRDLKPGNIILTSSGPRVIDFGIARPDDATAITRVGTVLGTPGFMAPEQVRGAVAGSAADVFALGAVLAFAATGREPFGSGERDVVLKRVATGAADLAGIGDPELVEVLTACLRVEPEARPSAAVLLDRFGHAAAAGWLPADVVDAIERRAAAARLMIDPRNGEAPAPSTTVLPNEPTEDPSFSQPMRETGRVGRRALLLGGGAVVLAGAVGAVVLGGRDEPGAPKAAAAPPTTTTTIPKEPARAWIRQVSNAAVFMHATAGTVFASNHDGGLRALDPRTGDLRWQSDTDRVTDVAGDTAVLVNPRSWRVSMVDAATGEPKWVYDPPVGEVSRSAVLAGDVVCFGTGMVRGIGAADGQPRWTAAVKAERGYIAAGDVLVCTTLNEVTGVDVHTGQVRWQFDPQEQPADPRSSGGMAYVCDASGVIRAVRAADGAVLWQQPGLGSSGPHWLVADANTMYYSADGEIRAYVAATGAPLWTHPIGRRTGEPDVYSNVDKSSIALAGDTLYALSNEGRRLYALNIVDAAEQWFYPAVSGAWEVVGTDGYVLLGTATGYVEAIRVPGGG